MGSGEINCLVCLLVVCEEKEKQFFVCVRPSVQLALGTPLPPSPSILFSWFLFWRGSRPQFKSNLSLSLSPRAFPDGRKREKKEKIDTVLFLFLFPPSLSLLCVWE